MGVTAFAAIFPLLAVSLVYCAPDINSPWGRIAGRDLISRDGRAFNGYLGIPYALPPLGERRFTKPQPHPGPGVGRVFNASSQGPVCPQPLEDGDGTPMSEDCLTLNVYTPAGTNGASSLQVMIWIHGGGYNFGSALEYSPPQLVTQGDVIVVIIQYRLGILGFLSSADDASPGNYGLWDQNMAIRWVKDNIRAFGGNPDSLTIFGESAGGGSVGLQILTPNSKGLFSRAILQSGTPLSPWSLQREPQKPLYVLANATRCMNPNEAEAPMWVQWYAQYADPMYLQYWRVQLHKRIVSCLKGVSLEQLVPFTFFDAFGGILNFYENVPWIPVVDRDFIPRDPAELVLDPDYLLSNGVLNRDVMYGVNNNEGGFLVQLLQDSMGLSESSSGESFEDFVTRFSSLELKYRYGKQLADNQPVLSALTDVVNFFYFTPQGGRQYSLQEVADMYSDTNFVAPTVRTIRGIADSAAKVKARNPQQRLGRSYLYLFDHYPTWAPGDQPGMAHGLDITYAFGPDDYNEREEFTAVDQDLANTFVSMLTGFAKTGDPNSAIGGQLNGAVWPEISPDQESYLALAPQPRVERDLYARRVGIWVDLVPTLLSYTRADLPPMTNNVWSPQYSGWNGGMMQMGQTTRQLWYYNQYMNTRFCF